MPRPHEIEFRMRNSRDEIPGVRKQGQRTWFANAARGMGFNTQDAIAGARRAIARINHGRWLADCPYCDGAELVHPDERFFVCLSCGNLGLGSPNKLDGDGRILHVEFPPNWHSIERILISRPDEVTRNWNPGETMADLRRENTEHGLENRS